MGIGGFAAGFAGGLTAGEKLKLDWRKADREDDENERAGDLHDARLGELERANAVEDNKTKYATYLSNLKAAHEDYLKSPEYKAWDDAGKSNEGLADRGDAPAFVAPERPAKTELPTAADLAKKRDERRLARKVRTFPGGFSKIKDWFGQSSTAGVGE